MHGPLAGSCRCLCCPSKAPAGFIRNSGILRRENAERIDEAYELYRSRSNAKHPRGIEATLFRRSYSHQTRIRFVGVWDTVGSLGIPLREAPLVDVFNRRWQFHDPALSGRVDAAFQALAIDEKRGTYRPTLWAPQPAAPQRQCIQQLWFSGVHSDVGGGYRQHVLSDIASLWMVERASECGLGFDADAIAEIHSGGDAASDDVTNPDMPIRLQPDPLARLHNSRVGIYRLLPQYVRELGVKDMAHEYLASSAVERHRLTTYVPPNLLDYLKRASQILPWRDSRVSVQA